MKKGIVFFLLIIFFSGVFYLHADDQPGQMDVRGFSIIVRGGLAAKMGNNVGLGLGTNLAFNYRHSRKGAVELVVGYHYYPITPGYTSHDAAGKLTLNFYRFFTPKRKKTLFFYGGFGLMVAEDEASANYGLSLGAGYEYKLSKHVALETGLNLNVTFGGAFFGSALVGWKYRF
jgi:hypothetical protein